jgi:type IV pilus assembly protein PilM
MPLTLYNFVLFDQMPTLPPIDEYDLDEPPESVVILSLGTDSTDLVITNGYRVWQRSIPLGGSHFTKALTKDLKLTFAKAEHLKRNATSAADPKAVFQSMRPVFGELLTELQRSISYFCNLDRTAKIGRVVALGNAMKLPGLRRYLSQSLGYEIDRLEAFQKLTGPQVVSAPAFEENLLSFGVCYGLALQGLGKAGVHTNLLPKEIIQQRLVKRKKPWAVAAAAVLLLGCALSFARFSLALGTVNSGDWDPAIRKANDVVKKANGFKNEFAQVKTEFDNINAIGKNLSGNIGGKIEWLQLLRAIDACLPSDDPSKPQPTDIADRNEIHITNLDCQWTDDVAIWFDGVKSFYRGVEAGDATASPDAEAAFPSGEGTTGIPSAPIAPTLANASSAQRSPSPSASPARSSMSNVGDGMEATAAGPSGSGWIINLQGFHYHNSDVENQGADYVRKTIIENLQKMRIKLPNSEGTEEEVSMSALKISYPTLVAPGSPLPILIPDPNAQTEAVDANGQSITIGAGGPNSGRDPMGRDRRPDSMGRDRGQNSMVRDPSRAPNYGRTPTGSGSNGAISGGGAFNPNVRGINAMKFEFRIQFCWQPEGLSQKTANSGGPGDAPGSVASRPIGP